MKPELKEKLNSEFTLDMVRPYFSDLVFFCLIVFCMVQIPVTCFFYYAFMEPMNPVVSVLGGGFLVGYCIKYTKGTSFSYSVKNNIPILVYLLFGALVIISTIFTCIDSITFITHGNNSESTFTHLSYIVWFLMGIGLGREKLRAWIIRVYIISSAVFTLFYIWKAAQKADVIHFISVFVNSNHIGYYLMLCVMVSALWGIFGKYLLERIASLAVFSIAVYALVYNNTLGCQIAVVIGLIFTFFVVLLCRGKACLKVLIPIGLAVLVFALSVALPLNGSSASDGNARGNAEEIVNDISALSTGFADADDHLGSGRMLLWKDGINKIKEKPILGWGGENAGNLVYGTGKSGIRVHNEYLQYAIDFGIPAAVIYVLAILAVFIRGLRHRKELTDINIVALCTAFAYFVSAFFGIRLYFLVPFVMFLFGMGYWKPTPAPEAEGVAEIEKPQTVSSDNSFAGAEPENGGLE